MTVSVNKEKLTYSAKESTRMSAKELAECAALFSSSYGKYSTNSPKRPNQQIVMSPSFFEKRYRKDNVYVATCKYYGHLVAQAIYIRHNFENVGTMTWVMQLVVKRKYRNMGIGGELLHAIWGFSNDFAWGLATTNPCTVKALERATFRRCNPRIIKKNLDYIKRLSGLIDFVPSNEYEIEDNLSIANTEFFVDNHEYANEGSMNDWQLGELKPGYEWLAFTFRDQAIDLKLYQKHYERMIEFSEKQLKTAYSRMKMPLHKWAMHEKEEIDQILQMIPVYPQNALDFGCGQGRHSIELAKRAVKTIGIDFSSNNIRKAKNKAKNINVQFITADARDYTAIKEVDLALALYDVVGSFPNDTDNKSIIANINKNLKKGGYAVISVMNRSLTEHLVDNGQKGDVNDNPELLYALKPSDTMQKSGDIFDGRYIVIDEKNGVIYRKEQFSNDNELPAEYLIRDRRYYFDEIKKLCEECGFTVERTAYVQAGHFDVPLEKDDPKAKEILLVLRK